MRAGLDRINAYKSLKPEDALLVRKLNDTHAPGFRNFDFRYLLPVVGDILSGDTSAITGGNVTAQATGKVLEGGSDDRFDVFALEILRLSGEISYMCFTVHEGDKEHKITMKIAEKLSSYSWEDKVVLALAAFALYYGEAGLASQLHSTSTFAKAISIFKQLPLQEQVSVNTSSLPKLSSNDVSNLLKYMVDVTQCIISIREICDKFAGDDDADTSVAYDRMVKAVYWTIRGVAEFSTITSSLVHKQNQPRMGWDSSSRFNNLSIRLEDQLADLKRHIQDLKGGRENAENQPAKEASADMRRTTSPVQTSELRGKCWKLPVLQKICMSSSPTGNLSDETEPKTSTAEFFSLFNARHTRHTDNVGVLRTLFNTKNNQLPLFDGYSKKQAGIDELRRKTLLLIISDIGFSLKENFPVVSHLYDEVLHQKKRPENYEAVWLPVTNDPASLKEEQQKLFLATQASLPCFSVYHPKMLNPKFSKLAKQMLHFDQSLLVVVLDPQGRVVNTNALHMLRIWGSAAFPFTSSREEEMWKKESWRVDLLVQSIGPMIRTLKSEGKYICLYGGRNLEWIQNFRTKARETADMAHISLNMIYLGRRNPGDKVQKIINTIVATDKLDDHVLPDTASIKLFWDRLESMWHSKLKVGKSPKNDSIMQELMLLFDFDCSDQGWALFSKGYSVAGQMAKAKGDTVLKSLASFESWKQDALRKGFVAALDEQVRAVSNALHHSNSMVSPAASRIAETVIPENLLCSECKWPMDKFLSYQCPRD